MSKLSHAWALIIGVLLPGLSPTALQSIGTRPLQYIEHPQDTPPDVYYYTSNIATDGKTGNGDDVRVMIRQGSATGDIVADSDVIDVPKDARNWRHNFPAPADGWPTGFDFHCVLYNAQGIEVDDHVLIITRNAGAESKRLHRDALK